MPQHTIRYTSAFSDGNIRSCPACKKWWLDAADGLHVVTDNPNGPVAFKGFTGYWGRIDDGFVVYGSSPNWGEEEVLRVGCGNPFCLTQLKDMPGVVSATQKRGVHVVALVDHEAGKTVYLFSPKAVNPDVAENLEKYLPRLRDGDLDNGFWLDRVASIVARDHQLAWSLTPPSKFVRSVDVDTAEAKLRMKDALSKVTRATGLPREE